MQYAIDAYNVVVPENNDLSPKTLANDIDGLVTATILLQSYALVLERQPTLITNADQFNLTNQAVTVQRSLKRHATFALDRLICKALDALTDVNSAANLMGSIKTVLAQSNQPTQKLADILSSLGNSIEHFEETAHNLSERIEREVPKVSAAEETLDRAITEVIQQIEGDNGTLAQIRQEIDAKKADIELNITSILRSGETLSQGLKTMFTGVLTSFRTSQEEAAEAEKKNDKENDKKADPKTGGRTDRREGGKQTKAKKENGNETAATPKLTSLATIFNQDTANQTASIFDVEAIGGVASSVSDGQLGVNQLIENNHELAELYQTLAQTNGLLTAAQAIRDQVNDYRRAIHQVSVQADHVEKTWGKIQAGFMSMKTALRTAPPEETEESDEVLVQTTIACAARDWRRVRDRISELENAVTGVGEAFSHLNVPDPSPDALR